MPRAACSARAHASSSWSIDDAPGRDSAMAVCARAYRSLRRPACRGVGGRRRPRVARVAEARRSRSGPARARDRGPSPKRDRVGSSTTGSDRTSAHHRLASAAEAMGTGERRSGDVPTGSCLSPTPRDVVHHRRPGPIRRVTGTLRRRSLRSHRASEPRGDGVPAARRAPARGRGSVGQRGQRTLRLLSSMVHGVSGVVPGARRGDRRCAPDPLQDVSRPSSDRCASRASSRQVNRSRW